MREILCLLLLVIWNCRVAESVEPEYKLEQLQVLLRHGDRVPTQREIYPTDPYKEIYKTLGYALLTKAGKEREFEIGRAIRQRFGNFIADVESSDIFAYSTNSDRTKESLKLALKGLESPIGISWNDTAAKSSIPTYFETYDKNFLQGFDCPEYKEMQEEAEKAPEILARLEKYSDFNKYVKNQTKIELDWPFLPMRVYHNVHAALSMGLPLPEWCTQEDYNKLEEVTAIFFDVQALTESMNRFVVGPMIEQFLENIESEHSRHGKRKIYLYCGHDMNIGTFTRAHNFTDAPSVPDYGSTIVLEKLRGSDNQIYIRFSMWNAASKEWIPLTVEECGEVCPISVYKRIIRHILPDEEVAKCKSERAVFSN